MIIIELCAFELTKVTSIFFCVRVAVNCNLGIQNGRITNLLYYRRVLDVLDAYNFLTALLIGIDILSRHGKFYTVLQKSSACQLHGVQGCFSTHKHHQDATL